MADSKLRSWGKKPEIQRGEINAQLLHNNGGIFCLFSEGLSAQTMYHLRTE
jgi:hypothetical protein